MQTVYRPHERKGVLNMEIKMHTPAALYSRALTEWYISGESR
jgi:hypothetical protein